MEELREQRKEGRQEREGGWERRRDDGGEKEERSWGREGGRVRGKGGR